MVLVSKLSFPCSIFVFFVVFVLYYALWPRLTLVLLFLRGPIRFFFLVVFIVSVKSGNKRDADGRRGDAGVPG